MTDPLEQDAPSAQAVEPDMRIWSGVLDGPCPVCSFDAGAVAPAQLGTRLRDAVPRWQAVLARPGADVRSRPGIWSPLEYGCHVRDIVAVFGARLHLMLRTDEPLFEDWDQDIAALDGEYARQDPAEVSTELTLACQTVADALDAVTDDEWARTANRSDGSTFTVLTLGRYLLHDVMHHLHDVGG